MTSTPAASAVADSATRIRVRLPASFDFAWTQRFLQTRCVSSLEAWAGDTYTRSLWLGEEREPQRHRGGSRSGSKRDGDRDSDAAHAGADGDGDALEGAGGVTLTIRHVAGSESGSGSGGEARLEVSCTPAIGRERLRSVVVKLFDLDADLDAFATLVRRDKILGPLIRRRPHVRLPRLIDPFEGLVRAMLGQQVTVRAASTMTDRFARQFGTPLDGSDLPSTTAAAAAARVAAAANSGDRADKPAKTGARERGPSVAGMQLPSPASAAPAMTPLFAFPRPEVIARAGADALRTIGLTRAKAKAIAGLAEALSSGRLDCARLLALPPDEAQAALLAVPGIGPWTASYVRMRVLGDRDAFPAADLGVIKALEGLGVPRAGHIALAEGWRPWRAYATLHLWESLSA